MFFVWIKIWFATSLMTREFPYGIFFIIDQVQVILLLALIGEFFPPKIMMFYHTLRHFLLNFTYLPTSDYLMDYWFYRQEQLAMYLLGFQDLSSIRNLFNWFWVISGVLIIHFFMYYIKERFTNSYQKGFLWKPFRELGNWLTLGLYIRFFKVSLALLLLATITEISYFKTWTKTYSLTASIIFASVIALLVLIPILDYMYRLCKGKVEASHPLSEFYKDIRKNRYWMSFTWMYLIHRISLVWLVSIDWRIKSKTELSFFVAIQGVYIFYLLVWYPFQDWRLNYLKIVTETFILFYWIPIFYYDNKWKWPDRVKW